VLIVAIEFILSPFLHLIVGANRQLYGVYVYMYIISAYTIIAIIVSVENDLAESFSLDFVSLLIIAASCLFRIEFNIKNEGPYLTILTLLGLIIIFIIIKRRFIKLKFNLKNFPLIFLWICATIVFIAIAETIGAKMLNPVANTTPQINSWRVIFRSIIYQVSSITVIEEVFFRGFIPGYLIKLGFKEKVAFIIQAIVFWLLHLNKIDNPFIFFISIPLFTISTTAIVWRYKTIALAILIHTLVNVAVPVIVYYVI